MLCCQNCKYLYHGMCRKHYIDMSIYERYTRICDYHTVNDDDVETICDKLRKANYRFVEPIS